ncbi:MAG: hypothetical protein H6851_18890 [Geminicoccaceae bacterium]|nr:hypothetical protein [Geminicoccaceae bacterium]
MQISATGNAPVTYRSPAAENNRRAEFDLGDSAAQTRSGADQAADRRGQADKVRADEVRVAQAQMVRAVEATNRANTPEPATDVIAESGGEGQLRGSRLDISI